jgi:hypothetical protein
MRFDRFGHYEYQDTRRKRLAFLRKQVKEQQSYPLFAEQIAAEQIDVEQEMMQRKEGWSKRFAEDRAARAGKWRAARARLSQHCDRTALLAYWQRCRWPGDPSYLLSMLHMYDDGRLDLNPPAPRQTEAQREAVKSTIARIHAEVAARRADVGAYNNRPL